MEFSNSGANHAVSHAQITRRSLGHIETCNSDPKEAVLQAKYADEGWNQKRLVILKLIALFYMHKTTAEVWDQWRLVFPLLITLFCMHKTIGEVLDP